jgi:hypothetical protein
MVGQHQADKVDVAIPRSRDGAHGHVHLLHTRDQLGPIGVVTSAVLIIVSSCSSNRSRRETGHSKRNEQFDCSLHAFSPGGSSPVNATVRTRNAERMCRGVVNRSRKKLREPVPISETTSPCCNTTVQRIVWNGTPRSCSVSGTGFVTPRSIV